ncbi:MAG: MBL fold metallo-hydrolase [Oscillospiraceae bacterium]|jgi:phosphoribosyl 1,2-cyclic phosphodiesterase
MPEIRTLYSGSSGNCTVVTGTGGRLLVDMGRSCRYTVRELGECGIDVSEIRALLITHEHSDHISGLMTFLKNYRMPVYGPRAVLNYLLMNRLVPAGADLNPLDPESTFSEAGLDIKIFRTPHDSVDCAGYRFDGPSGSCAIATDLGEMTDGIMRNLAGCSSVVIESNYDEGLLMTGPYPFPLKRRILSNVGHLANTDSSEAAVRLAETGTRFIELAHLSAENNTPSLALKTCIGMLSENGLHADVQTAPRSEPGRTMEF